MAWAINMKYIEKLKLTRYIASRFIGISALLILLSIPVFYFVLQRIMHNNVDENLRYQKDWIITQMQTQTPDNFSKFNQNVAISEVKDILRTTDLYNTKDIYVENDDEFVNHRVLDFYKSINGKNYHFKIKKSLLESQDVLETVIFLQLGLFVLLTLSLLLININVEKKVWKPFYGTLESLHQYRIDFQNLTVPEKSIISEIDDLNSSLTDLTERNQKLYTAQKEFTENASHELQTPLAVIQNKLELLMQTEPLNEQQSLYISDIYRSNQKISKLSKSLLLLSKIENHQFEQNQEIALPAVIRKISDDFSFIIQSKNISLIIDNEDDVTVNANDALINMLFGNLISNALKYTPENGKVHIILNQKNFRIYNSSEGGALDENRLFRRFQKQSGSSESTGLGLEICKKICILYGWTLEYSFEREIHIFAVDFNMA